jgi:glycerol-3-phosphate O-acyltransferase
VEKILSSKDPFAALLEDYIKKGWINDKIKTILEQFYHSYCDAMRNHPASLDRFLPLFTTYLNLVKEQLQTPFIFQPYHQKIEHPFNYYRFGIDFLRHLVDKDHSSVSGLEHLKAIEQQMREGHNVVFFANHQTEADPMAISILLEETDPVLASDMIFIAGERVITDPLAIPFSMGRNLLCIYSKRYIDHPPEQKHYKQMHNKKTMELMSQLLKQGSKAIYVAPSGGRDRANAKGVIEVAPFDPQSLEMFYLMSLKAGTPTHFYPMALATYDLLPPPESVQRELGEVRSAKRAAIHLKIGSEIDMAHFPGADHPDKHERRKNRANFIWELVKADYTNISTL